MLSRRAFFALAGGLPPVRKGLTITMLPATLGYPERFQLAREAGFGLVECMTVVDDAEAIAIGKAAASAGVRIHSVMNASHWEFPLSSPGPAVAAKGLEGVRTSLNNARRWGADAVLVVPAVVTAETGYREAWERSQAAIRKLLPMAADLGIQLAIENVWNRFLLSPLEFARYVDEFRSPWVRAYFDIGNSLLCGYPQDWIRTLGRRIVKLHVKDTKARRSVLPGDGEVDWKQVSKALAEVGYRGPATCELPPGDLAYLRDLGERMDRLLNW